jgi:hypothetical protein
MLAFDEFAEILAPLIAYCKDEFDKNLATIYYAKLQDLTPGAFESAVNHWLATSSDRWIPSIGELRELALHYQHGRRMHWQEAWGRILEAAEVFSQQHKPFAERARAMVGKELMVFVKNILGGFLNIREADAKTLSVMQSNFRDAYTRTEQERIEQLKLPEGMRVPHKVIVQHTAKALGLPDLKTPMKDET